MLEAESLPAPVGKEKKQSTAKAGKRQLTNLPKTLGAKKLRLPPTSFRRPGLILPPRIDVNSVNIQYQDLNALCRIAMDGTISKEMLKEVQSTDDEYGQIYHSINRFPHFFKHLDLLFHKKNDLVRLVIPKSLILPIVNSKHYSIYGVHFSATRIKRDIMGKYYIKPTDLDQTIKDVINSCITCQMSANVPTQQLLKRFDKVTLPRTTWAIDLITNMNATEQGNTTILIAIDMYTCYIQAIPLKNRTTKEIIIAIEERIIAPFGTPELIRSDNEAGMENSTLFYEFCHEHQIQFLPTSTGAPWANGAAERAVQTIKKALKLFSLHQHCVKTWDKNIHLVTNAHNKSIGVYGVTPEEAMFGYSNPNKTDIISFWPEDLRIDEYTDRILALAHEKREKMKFETERHMRRNLTYRNKARQDKKFERGNVVIHRNIQVASGPNSATQSKFDGPYMILEVYPNIHQALLENMTTKRQMKAHFTNIQRLKFNPQHNRVPENLDDSLELYFPDRQSQTLTQTQRQAHRDSQPLPRDPSLKVGTDIQDQHTHTQHSQQGHEAPTTSKTNPFVDSDSEDGDIIQSSQINQKRGRYKTRQITKTTNNPFINDDSDDENNQQSDLREQDPDTDWDQFDNFDFSQGHSQRPGTPFNRSPIQSSPEGGEQGESTDSEDDDLRRDIEHYRNLAKHHRDDSPDWTKTVIQDSQEDDSDSVHVSLPEWTTAAVQQTKRSDIVYISLNTIPNSKTPKVTGVRVLPKASVQSIEAPEQRSQTTKKVATHTQKSVPVRVVTDEDAELIQTTPRSSTNKAKQVQVKVRHVQDDEVPLMQDINVKPKRGRPKKDSKPKEATEQGRQPPRQVQHRYDTRSKAALHSGNAAQVYMVSSVMYKKRLSDGTYLDVYGLEAT
jgi:hypothetical protein